MKLHIKYLLSLEQSERVRSACLTYLQNHWVDFYPERPDIIAEMQAMAAEFQGHLEAPRLRRKYSWLEPVLGYNLTKTIQTNLPLLKSSLVRTWDRTMFNLETQRGALHRDQ